MPAPLRVANCSGFFGDRRDAAREAVDGGPIDVLTGDWLAELTMYILHKARERRPGTGYASTFLHQMEDVLGTCVDRGIKVVSNAGGLNPQGCAEELARIAEHLGLDVSIAFVQGDDVLADLADWVASGHELRNIDTGETLADVGLDPITANAYIGGWAIADALAAGADVVVTGRVTDASLVVGPAAWHHGWGREDWDRLAGAVVVGHILECGAQATGGNYAFFSEVPDIARCGFPIAEVDDDGSAVITKHPGTGGLVSVGTVTAQLLYEIGAPDYQNPDVVARFDTIHLDQVGPHRVRVSGVRGAPAPAEAKIGLNCHGGFRNSMTFVITGRDVEGKAAVATQCLWERLPGGREAFDHADVRLVTAKDPSAPWPDDATSYLHVTVMSQDEGLAGRMFSSAVVETGLASYPGLYLTGPPRGASPYGVYWPTTVPADMVPQSYVIDGRSTPVPGPATAQCPAGPEPVSTTAAVEAGAWSDEPVVRAPLGVLAGARSGDKGGNANLGVWTRDPRAYEWLVEVLDARCVQLLLPELAGLEIDRYELPNLLALNFVVRGLLGRGVAATTRPDAQAKGLGEHLRACIVDMPASLAAGSTETSCS